MPLDAGTRIGPFEVVGQLGVGGMGEVYRARDTTLDRDVALKILPPEFVRDAERVARFRREAKTLAAINHPHIAQIHGFEDNAGTLALVMELVDGEDLSQRITRGPVPIDEALLIAKQIAEALEAAHEQGIIHRDLKPANIKVRPDGTVKVLDFGLAKAVDQGSGIGDQESGAANSPTITSPAMTMRGVILGTAIYMAPEQAKGKPVDRRADIWAFGCVLYEMLTGTRAFDGDDTTEILGAIVKTEPDWTRLPASTPQVAALLRRCLQKDPRRRQQHIGDARLDIDDAISDPTPRGQVDDSARRTTYVPWALTVIFAAAFGASLLIGRPASEVPATMRVDITTPPLMSLSQIAEFALSPDGRFIAFIAGAQNAPIFVRTLESGEVRQLPGTEGASQPFWSPDSRAVGFFVDDSLLRVELNGTAPATIVRGLDLTLGATWNRDGTILYGNGLDRPLMRVAATGGAPSPMTGLGAAGTLRAFPQFFPDGDRFLFAANQGPLSPPELRIGSLASGISQSLMPLTSGYVQVLPPDRVLYLREGELRAQRIDLQRSSMVGTPEAIATGVPEDGKTHGAFSVSTSGSIAFRSSGVSAELARFDRAGRLVARAAEPDSATPVGARESPDGTRIAIDRTVQGNRDVWILDTGRGSLTRVTSHPEVDGFPVWSPDGRRLAFESLRSGMFNLYVSQTSAGVEERLQESSNHQFPLDWSRDGRFLLYSEGGPGGGDLFALPMTGSARTPVRVASTNFVELDGRFSPNGRWVAYQTNRSGRHEIVVQQFPEPSPAATQVSVLGGHAPRWSADGRELYFMMRDGTLMVAEVKTSGARFEAGVPQALFRSSALQWFDLFQYDVDKSGRFLMTVANQAPPIQLLLNWRPNTP